MNGIFFKEEIYVLLDNDTMNEICIYHYDNKKNVSLYGGRIQITDGYYNWGRLIVDGIPIVKFEDQRIVNGLELSQIVSHLNAIQTNGVDTFLENYKKSIAFLYNEIKELNQKTESQLTIVQEDSKIKTILSELTKIRDLLLSVLAILFSLSTFMSAGLENERVVSICQSVIDSLA
jgi:hypothetical protein